MEMTVCGLKVGAFDGVAALSHEHGEQQQLDMRRKLVFSALAGDFDREGQAAVILYTVQYSTGNFELIRAQMHKYKTLNSKL